VLLAGCAAAPSEDAPTGNLAVIRGGAVSPPVVSAAGVAAPLGSIAPASIPQAVAQRRDALAGVFPQEISTGVVAVPRVTNGRIELQFDSSALFDVSSAQLRPQMLVILSRLAKWQRADGQVVLQVEGRESVQTVDDLGARRAASVGEFLIAEGAPAGRVRVQGVPIALVAPPGTPASQVVVFVLPVQTGSEAAAWSVPALTPPAQQ